MCPPILDTPSHSPSPSHPSGFECPVSCIELGLVIYFTYSNIHVSLLLSARVFSRVLVPFCIHTSNVWVIQSLQPRQHLMLSLIFFWLHCTGYGILVPWTGIEPVLLTLEAQSVNHWTDREVPIIFYFSHSDRCVVMSHWFKFSLLSWLRMLNTFSCHLYILFSEISLVKR